MQNIKFKVGDWLISDNCTAPRAYKVDSIDNQNYKLILPCKANFTIDNKDLRIAHLSEIPKEYRLTYEIY